MMLRVDYSWSTNEVPIDLAGWHIYASADRKAKGSLVAKEQAEARSATWTSGESLIYVRVLGVKKDGTEEAWTDVEPDEVFIQGRDAAHEPDAPATMQVAHVEPSLQGRVTLDPPTTADPASFVQVIQGADEFVGVLVAEQKVLPSGPIGPDGPPQQVSASFPLEGYGGTKSVTVRQMGAAGRPGAGTTRTVDELEEMAQFHEVAVASWSGTTRVNFPAAAATDTFEYDATDGCRMRTRPVVSAATGGAAGWGTLASGLLASSPLGGAYLRSMTVESDEVNIGGNRTFRLSISHTGARKAAVGAVTGRSMATFKTPLVPTRDIDTRSLAEGPSWFAREVRFDGKPRQPLRNFRWEYVVGTSSPVAHAAADYKPYVPGQYLKGQYVRVRLVASEPTGYHQVVCPTATIKALVPRRSYVGSGSPESAVTAPPGSHYFRTDGPPHHYVKSTGVGNTGWLASNAGATVTPPTGTGFPHITAGVQDAAAKLVESADVDASLKDPAAATAGLRTLGTGAATACAGNDSRLSDARAPTGAAGGVLSGTYPNPGLASGYLAPRSVVLTANQTGIGTSFADVTGLAFTLTSGKRYGFHFYVRAQADATTTGIDIAINGPAATFLEFMYSFWTSATNVTFRGGNGYDHSNPNLTSNGATPRIWEIYGTIRPSADGDLIVRAKREAVGSGPDVLDGSYGLCWQLD